MAGERGLDFEVLQQRIHPAASRVARLAHETPASFIAFDLLAVGAEDLRSTPGAARRARLIAELRATPSVAITPQTDDPDEAADWFTRYEGAGQAGGVVGGGVTEAGLRGELRLHAGRPFPPRRALSPLAHRQGPRAVHLRPAHPADQHRPR